MSAQPSHAPLEPVLSEADRDTARHIAKVIQLHRMQLNDRDKARQMTANEREIERFLEMQQ